MMHPYGMVSEYVAGPAAHLCSSFLCVVRTHACSVLCSVSRLVAAHRGAVCLRCWACDSNDSTVLAARAASLQPLLTDFVAHVMCRGPGRTLPVTWAHMHAHEHNIVNFPPEWAPVGFSGAASTSMHLCTCVQSLDTCRHTAWNWWQQPSMLTQDMYGMR